jgi:hypothetical protein
MPAATPLPTLSQVQTLNTAYLREAADYFARTGNLWDEVFTEIHERISTPGGTSWKGQAAAAEQARAYFDMVKIRPACYQLHEAAGIARRGDEQLQALKEEVLDAVHDARAGGFDVGEDYSVTDRSQGGSAEFRAERRAQAQGHAGYIRHRVAALVANDQELTAHISAATAGIGKLAFDESPDIGDNIAGDDKHSVVQPVDRHTFKDAPNPAPDPPPGGWSSDPLMRAAQKIAHGHALDGAHHLKDFPGMTRDQLADLIHKMMQDSINNPKGLILGNSVSDGAPVIYDPKTNIVVIYDPTGEARASDSRTAFKPPAGIDYIRGNPDKPLKPKIQEPVGSFSPDRFAPRPAGPPAGGQPAPLTPPPARAPVELPPVKPAPGVGEGSGGPPRLPFGIGVPGDSPAMGPHPVYPSHSIHRPPVLGENAEEFDG